MGHDFYKGIRKGFSFSIEGTYNKYGAGFYL